MPITIKTIRFAMMAAVLGLLAYGGAASAQGVDRPGDFSGIHRAARSIEKNAQDLHEEVDLHFRPSPVYQHLHRHTREIERLARAIHEIANEGRNRRILYEAVARLDDEIHHFVDVVEDSKQFNDIPPRAYEHLREEVRELHRAVRTMKRELD